MNIQKQFAIHVPDLGDDPDFPVPADIDCGGVMVNLGANGVRTYIERPIFEGLVEAEREFQSMKSALGLTSPDQAEDLPDGKPNEVTS